MDVSGREKKLVYGTLLVLGALAFDQFVLTPLMDHQDALAAERDKTSGEIQRARKLYTEQRSLVDEWKSFSSSGLKDAPSVVESRLLHALRDWARESGLALSSVQPDRSEPGKDRVAELRVQASGTGGMESISRFLWKVQSSPFPARVADLQVSSRTDGTGDMALQVKVATLYLAAGHAKQDTQSSGGRAK